MKDYIEMNFEGLRDDVLSMLAGETVPVNTGSFTNDMTTFRTKDDVFTLLVHLGYLAYDGKNKCVYIPNNEIRTEYVKYTENWQAEKDSQILCSFRKEDLQINRPW